jgi:hypothetical protein
MIEGVLLKKWRERARDFQIHGRHSTTVTRAASTRVRRDA